MIRRFLVFAVLAACASASIVAAERATFVLTDGERKSGAVVFHGSENENLINGFLNLGNDAGGPEFTVPIDQVAVIDFAGGRPSNAEYQALPDDQAHLLVLRNGATQRGRFVNLIGGTTLVWENDGGQRQNYGIRDVSRVYLNGNVAKTAYFRGQAGPQATVGTTGSAAPGSIRVDAGQPWIDSGVDVRKGDRLVFNTTGEVVVAPGASGNPDGVPGMRSNNYPVPGNQAGTLIAKIGAGAPFPIGTISRPVAMPATGRLMLGVNDDYFGDNSGGFWVRIVRSPDR